MTGGAALFILLALAAPLSGCASLAKGVTEALIGEPGKKVDTRKCYVRGRPVAGLEALIAKHRQGIRADGSDRPVLKVLMVHGIGSHQPGHSTRLAENLARTMGLDRVQERFKEIALAHPTLPNQELGLLRVTRYLNADGHREMVFAELTWDPIVEQEKQSIAFDNSGEYSFRRTAINNTLKEFVNATIPDVLMYNGSSRQKIQVAIGQSLCWLMSKSWAALPRQGTFHCDGESAHNLDRIDDDFIFITHSLGSRMTVDALQWIAAAVSERAPVNPAAAATMRKLREKEFTVFMLSNQLPLLQLGQAEPPVRGRIAEICPPNAPGTGERLFRATRLIAFSDPNDLFSYAIPHRFLEEHMDSRLCPTLTNVILNVVEPVNVFGGEVANPVSAHTEYDNDHRVIGIIARGISRGKLDPSVAGSCYWLEEVPGD